MPVRFDRNIEDALCIWFFSYCTRQLGISPDNISYVTHGNFTRSAKPATSLLQGANNPLLNVYLYSLIDDVGNWRQKLPAPLNTYFEHYRRRATRWLNGLINSAMHVYARFTFWLITNMHRERHWSLSDYKRRQLKTKEVPIFIFLKNSIAGLFWKEEFKIQITSAVFLVLHFLLLLTRVQALLNETLVDSVGNVITDAVIGINLDLFES